MLLTMMAKMMKWTMNDIQEVITQLHSFNPAGIVVMSFHRTYCYEATNLEITWDNIWSEHLFSSEDISPLATTTLKRQLCTQYMTWLLLSVK